MAGLHSLFKSYFSKFSNDDYDWVHYLSDYYPRLRKKSVMISLNPFRLNTYRYRLTDFLSEHNIPKEADWIVLLINQMGSEAEFVNRKWLLLPDMSDIELIRTEYDTVRAHAEQMRNKK